MTFVLVPRAKRYIVDLLLHYRRDSGTEWQIGRTENVSTSGLLFVPDELDGRLAPGEPLEMELVLPKVAKDPKVTHIVCAGQVIRAIDDALGVHSNSVAATISNYLFTDGTHDERTFEQVLAGDAP